MQSHDTATALIALDWGTSSLRALRYGRDGRVADWRRAAHGIMHLPAGGQPLARRFEHALQEVAGDWLRGAPGAPLLACGMVGSAQGWHEAGYVAAPCAIAAVASALAIVQREAGQPLHIVPGILRGGPLPNVMRGEETQIAGILRGLGDAAGQPLLVGLPGTHSKWAWVDAGHLTRFETFMTGEVYGALREHTLLGRTMATPAAPDDDAFLRGVGVAAGRGGDLGLLSSIFSCRTLGLTGQLPPAAQPDYLCGLLIGHELQALVRAAGSTGPGAVHTVLSGEPDLCRRYAMAMRALGVPPAQTVIDATASGLWQVARTAGLVPPDMEAST